MKDNVIKRKSMDFAIRIVKLKSFLQKNKEFDISGQVVRSGTAIGALISEAEYAESKADFVHKMRIALKEANETSYWLELLFKTDLLAEEAYDSIKRDNEELKKMLVCIINSSIKSV
ncbi:four helix bundle protein [Bacteroides salyersiae]|uniref:four helix bundle protein n=1 Tax=Bacteroides salyersiae TaxID=291644 RepID=UPI001C8CD58E|nr:four helix bundle protein [Bacteroides salyersiae]